MPVQSYFSDRLTLPVQSYFSDRLELPVQKIFCEMSGWLSWARLPGFLAATSSGQVT
jgi:hypothetical protein